MLITVLQVGLLVLLFNASPTCANACYRSPELGKTRRLVGVKQEILLRLGLEEEPTITPSDLPNTTDPAFLEEYEVVKKAQDLNYVHKPCANLDFNTKEMLLFHPTTVERVRPLTHSAFGDSCATNSSVDFYNTYKAKFYIDLRGKDYIANAQLHLRKSFLNSNTLPENRVVQKDRVDIFFITRPNDYYGEELRQFVQSVVLDPNDISGLTTINITNPIHWWLQIQENAVSHMGEIHFELNIKCPQPLTNGVHFIPNFQFFTESQLANEGQLVITTYKGRNRGAGGSNEHNRQKRQTSNNGLTFCTPTEFECCLNEMTINFKRDFNWTWVITPKEIPFNYCSGACPVHWGGSSDHAQLLEIYRSRPQRNPTAAPEPCCVPNSYAPITLGYYLKGVYKMKVFDDIVATSCACR